MYEVYKYSTIRSVKEKKEKKRGESMKENGLESKKGEGDGNRAKNMKGNGGEAREMGEVRTVQDVGRQFMKRRWTKIAGSYRNEITEFFPQ